MLAALLASSTGNAYLWRELAVRSAATAGSGESVSVPDLYAALRQRVNRRLGMGRDAPSFITPDDPSVAALVKELTRASNGDAKEYWRNCELLYRWVVQNIDYVPDSYSPLLPDAPGGEITWIGECWRQPAETLQDKAGDCEDQSALLTSLLLNYNRHTYSVWMLEIGNGVSGHIAVVFPIEKGMITIVDPSIQYNTAEGEGIVLSSREARAELTRWSERLEEKVPGAQVKRIFADDIYQEFTGNDDFLNWIAQGVR